MAILSSLKSRRLRSHKGEATQQIIVFPIQDEWFALPIFSVKKVIPRSETGGNHHDSSTAITVYEGKELLVLDIEHQVFGDRRDREPQPDSSTAALDKASTAKSSQLGLDQPIPSEVGIQSAGGYLLIIRDHQGELLGLPTKSAPAVRRVAQSAMVPLPASYAARINLRCVNGLIIQGDDDPILFFLNPDQLFHTQSLLPSTSPHSHIV